MTPPSEHSLSALAQGHRLAVEPALLGEIAREMADRGGVDARICGEVYERRLAGDRGARRAVGGYYTPDYLVDFVVDHTVGASLHGLDAEAALQLRVLDPACGGGVFLLAAAERIERHCVEAGHPAGPELRGRIARDCLFGIDIDAAAVDVCRLALALRGGDVGNIICGDALADDVVAGGGFDVVLGNPPWGQKGFAFSDGDKARLRQRFRCGKGVLDPFKLFVERAHELVRPGGRWGMVLPDIILLKNQQAIRELILAESELEWIAHAGRAFDGVNLDAVVICGRLGSPADAHEVSIWHELPDTWTDQAPPTHRLAQCVFRELPGSKLNIHLTRESLAMLQQLAPLPRFGDVFECHEGVHTGNARKKLFVDHKRNAHCHRLIVGRDELARYRLRWAGTWLDTSDEALDRDAGDYANLGRPEWHDRPKIVVRRTGDRVIAAYDSQGYYCTNNMFVVLPRRPMGELEMRAYVALLNSALTTWYFRTVQPRVGKLFAELKIQHLADFPVPPPERWTVGAVHGLAERRDVDTDVFDLFDLDPSQREVAVRSCR